MKHADCGCSLHELGYQHLNSFNSRKANHLLARGSKLCREVSDMDALISSQSNSYSEKSGKQTSDDFSSDTTEKTITQDNVPKVFIQPSRFENNLPPHDDTERCTSFLQKIVSNAKTILGTRCNVTHPLCSEEPTRETDNCDYDSNMRLTSHPKMRQVVDLPKYSLSDYCLCDGEAEDSLSKLESTTTAETIPNATSVTSKNNSTLDYSMQCQVSKTERSRITLGSLFSTSTNNPSCYGNVFQESGPYDLHNFSTDDPVNESKRYTKNISPSISNSGLFYRRAGNCGINNKQAVYFVGNTGTFRDQNHLENPNEFYIMNTGFHENSTTNKEYNNACDNKSTLAHPEVVDIGVAKSESSKPIFSLLDTTWINPFRRDTTKKPDIVQQNFNFNRSDTNSIPCHDITCYTVQERFRSFSAEPVKRKPDTRTHTPESYPRHQHTSRETRNSALTSNEASHKLKARSCDPHCKMCCKVNLSANKNNNCKTLVCTGCNPDFENIEMRTKTTYIGCNPNCPACSKKTSVIRNQRPPMRVNAYAGDMRLEPHRPPVVNTSVGSVNERALCVDSQVGEDETNLRSEKNIQRFIEESRTNMSHLKLTETTDETFKNDTNGGSQQETPSNSLSCQLSFASVEQSKTSCIVSCPSVNVNNCNTRQACKNQNNRKIEKRKNCIHNDLSPSVKIVRTNCQKDEDNQCAFIGSPILNSANFRGSTGSCCDQHNSSYNPNGSHCMKCKSNLTDNNSSCKDKNRNIDQGRCCEVDGILDGEILRIRDREVYESKISNLLNNPIASYLEERFPMYQRHDNYFGTIIGAGEAILDDEIKRVTRELKTENKVLKSELLEMKLELKHALEKVEGPMKSKLEAEKCRCEQLQQDLQKAAYDIKFSQDTYSKESKDLKMQLSLACTNMTQLEAINKRLRDEMNTLDGVCAKLEEDLVNQKLSEAETLKRLTKRCGSEMTKPSPTETLNETNLNIIARKLSKTIKEAKPCEECSNIPSELAGAAKIIKDLTDMVEKRKADIISLDTISITKTYYSKTNCSCQSPPCTEEIACQCFGNNDVAVEVSQSLLPNVRIPVLHVPAEDAALPTKTLFPVQRNFITEDDSSRNIIDCSHANCGYAPSPHYMVSEEAEVPELKNQSTDPKTADKKMSYNLPRFLLVEPVMVDKESNYETCEPCKGDGLEQIKEFQDAKENVLTCYMVKTPVRPVKPNTQDKASPPTMRDISTINSTTLAHEDGENINSANVKDVRSNYLSCEELETTRRPSTTSPPCGDIGMPCLKKLNKDQTQLSEGNKKTITNHLCEDMEAPPCENIGRPCLKDEECDATNIKRHKSPCWHIGEPCVKRLKLKGNEEAEADFENKPPVPEDTSCRYICEKTDDPPCSQQGIPCLNKKSQTPTAISEEPNNDKITESLLDFQSQPQSSRKQLTCDDVENPPCKRLKDAKIGDKINTKDVSTEDVVRKTDKEIGNDSVRVPDRGNSCGCGQNVEKTLAPKEYDEDEDAPCRPCGEDGPCAFIGRPCTKNLQKTSTSKQVEDELCPPCGENGPCAFIGRPCVKSLQENGLCPPCGDDKPCVSIGKPCTKIKENGSRPTLEDYTKPKVESKICGPCGEDKPCFSIGRPCSKDVEVGTKLFFENRPCSPCGDEEPCVSIGKPCTKDLQGPSIGADASTTTPFSSSSQTEETIDKRTDTDLTVTDNDPCAKIGKPCLKKKTKNVNELSSEVETSVDVLEEPPADVHLITTVVQDGNLEVITEGPLGVIETTLNYLPNGSLEVQTQIDEKPPQQDESRRTSKRSKKRDSFPKQIPSAAKKEFSSEMQKLLLNQKTSLISGESALTDIELDTEEEDSTKPIQEANREQIILCPVTNKPCVGLSKRASDQNKPMKKIPAVTSEGTQRRESRDTGIATEPKTMVEKDTVDGINTANAGDCICLELINKTTTVTKGITDKGIKTLVTPTKETPVNVEDLSVSSPQQTSQVEISVKSVGEEDTKATTASSTLPIEAVPKCECTADLHSDTAASAGEKEGSTEQETTTSSSIKEDSGTSPERLPKNEKAITIKPSNADKEQSKVAAPSQKRECGCQSTSPKEQSCQCCECRESWVSTTEYSEDIIRQTMEEDKFLVKDTDKPLTEKPSEKSHTKTEEGDEYHSAHDSIIKVLDESIQPPGSTKLPDGSILRSDGSILRPDGILILADGTLVTRSGSNLPRDSTVASDGTITLPDGTVFQPDGTVITPNGSVYPHGSVKSEDGIMDATVQQTDGTAITPDETRIASKTKPEEDFQLKGSKISKDESIVTTTEPYDSIPLMESVRSKTPLETKVSIRTKEGSTVQPDGTVVKPDGSITKQDRSIIEPEGRIQSKRSKLIEEGSIMQPDGSIVTPDGAVMQPDETVKTPDGVKTPDETIKKQSRISDFSKNGTIIQPDGTIVRSDGSVVKPDETIKPPDAHVPSIASKITKDGSVIQPDGTIVGPGGSVITSDGTAEPPNARVPSIASKITKDGSVIQPNGTIVRRDGSVVKPNGTIELTHARVASIASKITKDDSVIQPDGTMVRPNGSVIKPDGTIQPPDALAPLVASRITKDGSIIQPYGTIVRPDGSVVKPDGTTEPQDTGVPSIASRITKDGNGTLMRPDGSVVKPVGTIKPQDARISLTATSITKDGSVLQPDGTIVRPDESIVKPDVTIEPQDAHVLSRTSKITKDERVILLDGTILKPDGSVVKPDDRVPLRTSRITEDRSIMQPDGTIIKPDGSVVKPHKTIDAESKISKIAESESILRPDGTTVQPFGNIIRTDGAFTPLDIHLPLVAGKVPEAKSLMQPAGSIVTPDTTVFKPDGTIKPPSIHLQSKSSKITEDESLIRPGGDIVKAVESLEPDTIEVRADGTIARPDGSIIKPDGTILNPDGIIIQPDEKIYTEFGAVVKVESIVRSNGAIAKRDGTVIKPNGSVIKSDTIDTIAKSSEKVLKVVGSDQRPDAPIEKYDSSDVIFRRPTDKTDTIDKLDVKGASEVPDSVSKLSAKGLPPVESFDSGRPKRKRSSKFEIKPCNCTGLCNCIICAPDIMEKRKNQSKPDAERCHCGGMRQRPTDASTTSQAYNFGGQVLPDQLINNIATKPCPVQRKCQELYYARQKTRISIEDVFKPTYRKSNDQPMNQAILPPRFDKIDCECIDCLCSPVIRDLCSPKNIPNMNDEKQIYQVSNIKCACPNSKKVSKIPVSTNPAVPKVKVSCTCDPCQCSPCINESKRLGGKPATTSTLDEPGSDLPTTEQIMRMTPEQLKALCDCNPCSCEVCYNKPAKTGEISSDVKDDKEAPICCCKPGCVCELCQVEDMKQQIEKLRQEIEALKITKPPDVPEFEHEDDCDCPVCNCPEGPNKHKLAPPAVTDHSDDCTCDICQCPLSPLKQKVRPPGHPDDCDCDICKCPLAPEAGDMPGCNCGEYCTCPGNPNAGKKKKKEMTNCTCKPQCLCPGGPIPSCDCAECQCNPCADPRKKRRGSILTCDCSPCKCAPCADRKKAKPGDDDRHPPDCTCPECKCADDQPSPTDDEPPTVQCDCPICKCGEETAPTHPDECTCEVCKCSLEDEVQHPPDCTCEVCDCTPEDEPQEEPTHPEGCTCDVCKCSPPEEPTHPEGCICEICKCKEEMLEEEKLREEICVCPICACAEEKIGQPLCRCDPCNCNEEKKEEHPTLGALACTCGDTCACDQGDTVAATIQTDAAVSTMIARATHPVDCICTECTCADERGHQEAPKCRCTECKCSDCYYKSVTLPHAKDCQCPTCTCIDCLDTTTKQEEGDCKCVDCKCDPCLSQQKTEKEFTCKCGVCTCKECDGKKSEDKKDQKKVVIGGPLPKDRSCHCITCFCDECSNEKKQGSKSRPDIIIEATAMNTVDDSKTPIECTCLHCICVECVIKREAGGQGRSPNCKCLQCICAVESKMVQKKDEACHSATCDCAECRGSVPVSAVAALSPAPETKKTPEKQDKKCCCSTCQCEDCIVAGMKTNEAHSPDCKCATCTCLSCGNDALSVTKETECHCATCKCDDCVLKTIEGDHGPNCQCPTCKCTTCGEQYAVTKDAECHCADCKCAECTGMKSATGDHVADCTCPTCTCTTCGDTNQLPKKDVECHCALCKCKDCQEKTGTGSLDPPLFEVPKKIDCDCKNCTCVICSTKEQSSGPAVRAATATVTTPASCNCQNCNCCNSCIEPKKIGVTAEAGAASDVKPAKKKCSTICTCVALATINPMPRGVGAFLLPKTTPCICNSCQCAMCNKDKLAAAPGGDIFEVPVRLPCHCANCLCALCTKDQSLKQSAPTIAITTSSNVHARCAPGVSTDSCDCTSCASPSDCFSSAVKSANSSTCRCPECVVENTTSNSPDRTNTRIGTVIKQQKSYTSLSSACICDSCPNTNVKIEATSPIRNNAKELDWACRNYLPVSLDVEGLSTMDNASLAKKIAYDTKENFACKEQIKEIKSALYSIRAKCTDAEKKTIHKPLVKQASAFNQTMSGLKLALTNLQEKCKAKDKMIEVMTGELKNRTSSQTLLNVLNTCTGDAPDYDRAEDVQDNKKTCNYLHPVSEEKYTFDEKIAKAVETERSHKKRKYKPCKCGKIHKNKDNKNVDLSGFEVVDIKRITHDSIIIKWRPPKSDLVTGYDIFINNENKSKVMSGGRTSAMVYSIDLSATIQITIYAVTKCGRCEPPAIAIYEIR